ncbi:MAG: hypothetical protein ACYDHB_13645 [Candidatus Dormibacteria bacterium]
MGRLREIVPQLWAGRYRLGSAVILAGLLTGGSGAVLAAVAASPVSASGVSLCGVQIPVIYPGDSGTCSATMVYTGAVSSGPVDLNVTTTSLAGSGVAGSGTAAEALLDGQSTGLQISLAESATGSSYSIGQVSCTGTYPNASSCHSSDLGQVVTSGSVNPGFKEVVVVNWSLPLAAGNPYEGGLATVKLWATIGGVVVRPIPNTPATRTPRSTGVVKGVSTAGPTPSPSRSPSKHHGVLAASTPTTGAQLPIVLSRILIVLGVGLVFAGLWMWRRKRYFGPG